MLLTNTSTGQTSYYVVLDQSDISSLPAHLPLLSITTAPTGSFTKGAMYYNSTDRLIYTAVADNTWENAKTSVPEMGIIYEYGSNYYQWDGDNLVETDLEKYQLLLISGENIKTINGQSILGSGNIPVQTPLPSQAGNAGKFLSTDGTTLSWQESSVTTLTFFEGTTGTMLDTQLTLGNAVTVFKNGMLLQSTEDYTISGSVITFVSALVATDKVAVINGNLSVVNMTDYQKSANVVTIDTAAVTIDEVKGNTNYKLTNSNITSITLTACETSEDTTKIDFTTGATAPTFTDNSGIEWADGETPVFYAYQHYWIVICDKIGFVKEIY